MTNQEEVNTVEAIQFEVQKPRPPKIVLYGVEGIGKTTFGALAPKPVFIKAEDGLVAGKFKDVESFPMVKTYADLIGRIKLLGKGGHDRQTLVIDSLDRVEPLIFNQVALENKVEHIGDIPYGRGFENAIDLWREYLSLLDALMKHRNMAVIQLAHGKVVKYANPETETYDRYTVKLHESSSGKTSAARLIMEDADMVLFANYFVGVTKTSDGDRQRAVGSSNQRTLFTEERPVAVAKNRFDLPATIPFDKEGKYWDVIKEHVPFYAQAK